MNMIQRPKIIVFRALFIEFSLDLEPGWLIPATAFRPATPIDILKLDERTLFMQRLEVFKTIHDCWQVGGNRVTLLHQRVQLRNLQSNHSHLDDTVNSSRK